MKTHAWPRTLAVLAAGVVGSAQLAPATAQEMIAMPTTPSMSAPVMNGQAMMADGAVLPHDSVVMDSTIYPSGTALGGPVLAGPATAASLSTDAPPYSVALQVEGIFMKRGTTDKNVLLQVLPEDEIVDFAIPIRAASVIDTFDASDFSYEFEAGLRVIGEYRLGATSTLEAVYFGLVETYSDFSARPLEGQILTGPLTATGALRPEGVDLGTDFVYTFTHRTELNNLELNYIEEMGSTSGFSLETGLGFRYVNLQENLDFLAVYTSTAEEFTDINTHNDVLAAQLIVRAVRSYGPLRLIAGAKGGLGANVIDVNSSYTPTNFDDPNLVARSNEDEDVAFSTVLDLNLGAEWYVTPHFAMTGGYQFLWITGYASAPEQVVDNVAINPVTADTGGQIHYHGLYFGGRVEL